MKSNYKTIVAIFTLVGAIIGAGIFAVPLAISMVGLIPALIYFVVLAAVQIIQNLNYGQVTTVVGLKKRLPGLADKILGKNMRHLAALGSIASFWSALAVYIILGGTFLKTILAAWNWSGPTLLYMVIWAVVSALIAYFGFKTVTFFDVGATLLMIGVVLVIFGALGPHLVLANLQPLNWRDPIMPFGVILFALSGITAIPEINEIVAGKRRALVKAIVWGTLLATLLTFIFGVVIWGVAGAKVATDVATIVTNVAGSRLAWLTALFGFLAISTSYFPTVLNVRETFSYDYKFSRREAWILAVCPPIILALIPGVNFVSLIGFSGAVFGAMTTFVITRLFVQISENKLRNAIAWLVFLLLFIGASLEIFETVKRFLV